MPISQTANKMLLKEHEPLNLEKRQQPGDPALCVLKVKNTD